MSLSGGKIAGGNPAHGREEHDFYATNPVAVQSLINKYPLVGNRILEPSVGQGHIANFLKMEYPDAEVTGVDLIDRGYNGVIVQDFLTYKPEQPYDVVITNPPFSLAQEFIEHSMDCVKDGGQICMFLKIQFLEGAKRKEMYEKYPPKYIYVFRNRMSTWMNGSQVDENGKKWSTTMCHAWFIWEKGSTTEPIVRWL